MEKHFFFTTKTLFTTLGFFALLAFVYFGNTTFTARNIIDYDDLNIVKPLLTIDWNTYITERLPNRSLYAFPVTDASFMLDAKLESTFGFPFLWISQFAYFCVGFLGWIATSSLLLKNKKLVAVFAVLYGIFPLNTEVIQWMTQRRYTLQNIFLAWGTYFFFKILKNDISLKKSHWATLAAAWIGAILAYPNSILWLPCLVLLLVLTKRLNKKEVLLSGISTLLVSATYIKLTASGAGGWTYLATNLFTEEGMFERAVHFGSNAIGRAVWNFCFPFWPAPYYNEASRLSWIGWAIVFALFAIVITKYKQKFTLMNIASGVRQGPLALLALAAAVTLPAANTILPFADFMLADRHLFLATPSLILTILLLGEQKFSSTSTNKAMTKRVLWGLFAIWICMCVKTIWTYAPNWENDFTLMSECARTERSPRCISQVIRRYFFKGRCSALNEYFAYATELYPNRPPFTTEFSLETPLYHSACAGLSLSMDYEQRKSFIERISPIYENSAELILGEVLSELRSGHRDLAFKIAKTYYASGMPKGHIISTFSNINIYRGHLRALCEIINTADCHFAETRFREIHANQPFMGGADNWGYSITHLAAGTKPK